VASRSTSRSLKRTLRTLAGKVARRLSHRLDSVQQRLLWDDPATDAARVTAIRHRALYEFADRIRRIDGDIDPTRTRDGRPALPEVATTTAIRKEALLHGAEHRFFDSLSAGHPTDQAVVRALRALLSQGQLHRARAIAASLQSRPEFGHTGDLAMALVCLRDEMPETAWQLFERVELEAVLRLAAAEYLRSTFKHEPAKGVDLLRRILDGEYRIVARPEQWLDIARSSFVVDLELSRRALAVARSVAADATREDFVQRLDWIERWYPVVARAQDEVRAPEGTIPFAVLDYDMPDQDFSTRNLGDHVQTISSLGHLVRHTGFSFTGDPELVGVAENLQSRVKPERRIDGDDATFSLYRIDRDATSCYAVPDGTWSVVFGWFMFPIFKMRFDVPLNPRLRPIFISFHVNNIAMLTPEMIEYLRTYSPVGCRDWNTVHLLLAAGVPAFFSGCLTTTVDTVFPAGVGPARKGTIFVDSRPTGPGEEWSQVSDEVRFGSFSHNIDQALAQLERYRSTFRHVITSRLHCYLPSRSLGADVTFKHKNPADSRFDGLVGITDEQFDAVRRDILDKLNVVMTAIGRGASEDAVYAAWREICQPAVDEALARRAAVEPIAPPTFDVAEACRTVHAGSVTIERRQPGPAGDEVHVEFSLDGNLKHQLDVVLDSVVQNSSRPVRAYLLCRDHDRADFERVARNFPTVSFVWLPTDAVDYGEILGMIVHITIATMDRLLLPELLPDLPKIIHHDLDALCVGDIAELFDTELDDSPLAARTSPQPDARSGFRGFIKASARLGQRPERARELIVRTHTSHRFDFEGFNAGIMVMNLDRMRRDSFCRNFLPYAERFGMNDQEILNAYAGADRVHLDPDWNRLPRLEVMTGPKIIHWAGFQKPWNAEWVVAKEYWEEYERRFSERTGAPASA